MKTILINREGFKKVMNLSKDSPYITIVTMPTIDWQQKHEMTEVINLEKRTFYFKRSFYDEDELEVRIFKEER